MFVEDIGKCCVVQFLEVDVVYWVGLYQGYVVFVQVGNGMGCYYCGCMFVQLVVEQVFGVYQYWFDGLQGIVEIEQDCFDRGGSG